LDHTEVFANLSSAEQLKQFLKQWKYFNTEKTLGFSFFKVTFQLEM